MRVRHKPYARPELAAWPYHIDDPKLLIGRWSGAFVNPALPVCVELGCGKGGFLSQISQRDISANFLGVDIKSEMLLVAKRTIERDFKSFNKSIDNVLLTNYNVEKMGEILNEEDNVHRVYINFCNPWYKSGHAKHRLTHPRQLLQIRGFLIENGEIYFKTDDELLFDDSLRYFKYTGFEVVWQTRDLHREEPAWNVRTEHENMFSARGIPIKACIVRKIENVKLDADAITRLKTL